MPRILDSSPVILQTAKPAPAPAPRRSLKRTASAASLPTPPRTRSDKKRLRRDVSVSEEDEEEEEEQRFSSDDEPEEKPIARVLFEPKSVARSAGKAKKSEKSGKSAEDVFWLGPDVGEERTSESPKVKGKKKAPSTIGSAPVSPPPSRRNQVGPRFQTPPPPVHARTPSTSSSGAGRPVVLPEDDDGPIRDTPNNLFLVDSKKSYPKQPHKKDADSYEEPPTVTYVFRGKRAEFPNPHYHRSPRAEARSKLPPEHKDFSPSPTVKPVRLFEDVESSPKGNKRKRTSTPSASPSPKARSKRKVTTLKKRGSPKKAS